MEKTPTTSDESRVGFSPENPVYVRAIAAEAGRALERLADAFAGLAEAGEPAAGSSPVFELHVEIPWDFAPRPSHPVGRPAYGQAYLPHNVEAASGGGILPPIDLSDVPSVGEECDREEGQRRIEEVVRAGRGDGVARFGALTSASHLTLELAGDRPEWRDLPVDLDSHGRRFALRMDLREWLDRHIPHPESAAAGLVGPEEGWETTCRERAVDTISAGFVLGFGHAAPEDLPAFLGEPLLELLDGEIPTLPKPAFAVGEKKALALVQFGPCVLDGAAERAYFTLGASVLLFDEDPASEGVGRSPTAEEIPVVVAALRELARAYRPSESIFDPAPPAEPPAPPARRAKAPSLLLDVRARMDPETVKLSSFAVEGTLPRRWRKARRWEDAEEERVAEILRQHGDAAFEKTDSRSALLTRRRGAAVLVERERNRLETDLGSRGGFIRSDSDGEWLVRALRVGAGFVTVGISWFRSAERLISERREEWAKDFRSRLAERAQRRLAFDELSDDEKEKLEQVLEHIGTLEDARRILDLVLRRAFATGAKVVDFPAHELRLLLECDGPEDRGNERIRRGLAALEELSFKVVHKAIKGTPSARFQGRFVATHWYFAAGEGARSDGVFVVELASPVPGVAALLSEASRGRSALGRQAARAALESATHPTATERSLELLAGEKIDDGPRLRRRRTKGERPAKALSTLGPYRKRAVCRTIHEERAFDFLEGNLTTSLAPDLLGRKKRERKETGTHEGLRVYSREWCPLLGDGEWVAALGTHRRSPESGWTLAGRGTASTKTGGGRPAGLIDHVGREYPGGSAHAGRRESALAALADFAAVLEPFGGVLVGVRDRKGRPRRPAEWAWVSLEEARELSTKELVGIRWYPFLPADWTRRGDELIEERQAARVARGEGERAVFVTRDPADYLAAAERDGVAWRHRPGEIEDLETWPADGRERPGGDVRPLGDRLAERIAAAGMKKGEVAAAFGVSPASLSRWLRPLAARDEKKGSGVPAALAGLVERWIEGGPLPTAEELEAVSSRRGKPRESGVRS